MCKESARSGDVFATPLLMDFTDWRSWLMEMSANPAQQSRPDDVGMSRSGGASDALSAHEFADKAAGAALARCGRVVVSRD